MEEGGEYHKVQFVHFLNVTNLTYAWMYILGT